MKDRLDSIDPAIARLLQDALRRWVGDDKALAVMATAPVLGRVSRGGANVDTVFYVPVDE